MDTFLSTFLMFWILILLSSTCKSETTCASDNFDMYTCCFNYTTPTSEVFIIKCPNTTSSIVVNDIVHLYGSGICSDIDVAFECSINFPRIVWRSGSNTVLSDQTCLNTNYICKFEIEPIQAGDMCNGAVENGDWSDAVRLTFKCNGGEDASMSTAFTTSTDFVSTNLEDKTSQAIDFVASSSTTNDVPIVETSIPSFSPEYEISYPSAVRSVSYEELPSSTFPTLTGIMTYSTKAPAQQKSAAGAIGGGIAAVVVVIVIMIIVILIVRRRKLQEAEKKNNVDNTKSDSNGHTYIDIDSTKTKPKKSKYEEVYATQEKDFPLKHSDSHETSHYCYVGRNECHGHTNDEEKPQYDNVENMTYDAPNTNRVDNQDQNHYDNINEEVENKNNEKIDLYAVPNKAKTGVSGDKTKMSLKRNMDGSEYSIYPTLPAKCFETLAEDPDRPKYAEIDMEKSGISASLPKNVAAKPSEDLNYAQIQF